MTPPRVTLRARTDDDADALYRLAADLDTWEERGESVPGPLTRQAWDARRAQAAETEDPERGAFFVVDVDGVAAGSAGLFATDPLARHAELAISLLPEVRGRGVGTDAVRLLVDFAFVRRNLRRVHLQAIASNAGALRCYAKAGFVVEGRLREHAWVRGAYEDVVVMGILRSER